MEIRSSYQINDSCLDWGNSAFWRWAIICRNITLSAEKIFEQNAIKPHLKIPFRTKNAYKNDNISLSMTLMTMLTPNQYH